MGCQCSVHQREAPSPSKCVDEGGDAVSGVVLERQATLGRFLHRPAISVGKMEDNNTLSVLPLVATFDKFDSDKSAGLSVDELAKALTQLGIPASSGQAATILKQYDQYPDLCIDIKEFASIVKDIQLLLAFDKNDDGVLDADELLPCLKSLGVVADATSVAAIIRRFDVDDSGTIDLAELSSLLRTARAFVRYDSDGSGTIDIDEMRDALRKLGLRAGTLEAQTLFRRYDADGNGTIELAEFAVLVADLQLYASFDTNLDGAVDEEELTGALTALGLRHDACADTAAAKRVLAAWDLAGDGVLTMSEFTQLASDVRTFRDADADADGWLNREELGVALAALGLPHGTADLDAALAEHGDDADGRRLSLAAFGHCVRALAAAHGLVARPMAHADVAVTVGAAGSMGRRRSRVLTGDGGDPSLLA